MAKILIMGLPGSGKTTLAQCLAQRWDAVHLNADVIRAQYNDWDFSSAGRERQAQRMGDLSDVAERHGKNVVADFVCPTQRMRDIYDADLLVFMDTISAGRFPDTNRLLEPPVHPDVHIQAWGHVEQQADDILEHVHQNTASPAFQYQHPTGLMIGRFQPFHGGHKKLFEKILEKQGQVIIMVRDTHGLDEKNPFDYPQVSRNIHEALDDEYRNRYTIMHAPNICGVYYGRDVGYEVERIHLDAETESISATDIRKKMAE